MIIQPSSTFADVRRLALAIQCQTKLLRFPEIPELRLSTSIGIAIHPNHGSDSIDLYQKADQALYRVKEQGGDGYLVYRKNMCKSTPAT